MHCITNGAIHSTGNRLLLENIQCTFVLSAVSTHYISSFFQRTQCESWRCGEFATAAMHVFRISRVIKGPVWRVSWHVLVVQLPLIKYSLDKQIEAELHESFRLQLYKHCPVFHRSAMSWQGSSAQLSVVKEKLSEGMQKLFGSFLQPRENRCQNISSLDTLWV